MLLGAFSSMRWGELVNLRRTDLDLVNSIVEVTSPSTSTSMTCDTGNQLAAEAGAATHELLRRMGHTTVRAAMRYQHSTDRPDGEVAAEISRRAGTAKGGRT